MILSTLIQKCAFAWYCASIYIIEMLSWVILYTQEDKLTAS